MRALFDAAIRGPPTCMGAGAAPGSEDEIARDELFCVVDEDGEVGLAVAVDVAAHHKVAALLLVVQLALLVVEALLLDELELVVLAALLGVDGGEVDEVLRREIEDRVAGRSSSSRSSSEGRTNCRPPMPPVN